MYRLMIVDDPEGCEAVRSLIDWQSCGFQVAGAASSCAEGVRLALELRPHLMLLNERLGCAVAEQLRAVGMRPVFAVMSGERDPERILRAMRAGARDFLSSPPEEGELRAFLERVIVDDLGGSLPPGEDVDPVLNRPCSQLSRITNRILLEVRSDCRRSLTLTSIAEGMHMSSKYIGRIFLKDTGMKFSEYLMAYRMTEARKRIVSTREKISVIAGTVGYAQLNNFYIHFRRYFGISPGAMRNLDGTENA